MSETQYDISQDLREAKAMADGLESYIKRDELYGAVGGGGFFNLSRMPALTPGALEMRLRRLHALSDDMTESQRSDLAAAQTARDAVVDQFRNRYIDRLTHEVNSRLKAMTTFFEECGKDPKLCSRVYIPEVLRRTTVAEALRVLDDLNADTDDLKKLARSQDSRLRPYVRPSDFVWAADLQPVYGQSDFWWMYHRPPTPEQ